MSTYSCIYSKQGFKFLNIPLQAHSNEESELEPKMKHICYFKYDEMKIL